MVIGAYLAEHMDNNYSPSNTSFNRLSESIGFLGFRASYDAMADAEDATAALARFHLLPSFVAEILFVQE
jgi:hypothetical protein